MEYGGGTKLPVFPLTRPFLASRPSRSQRSLDMAGVPPTSERAPKAIRIVEYGCVEYESPVVPFTLRPRLQHSVGMAGVPDHLSYPVSGSPCIDAQPVVQSPYRLEAPVFHSQTRIRMAHKLEIQSSATESR